MKFFRIFSFIDIINLLFWSILVIFFLISIEDTIYMAEAITIFGATLGLMIMAVYFRKKQKKYIFEKLVILIYPVFFLIFTFESLHMLMPYIMSEPYDKALAEIDHFIFGFDPTVQIEAVTTPVLTEIMYILYAFYFIMPFFILIYLFKQKKYLELDKSIVFYLLTYYGSYLMYFAFPALGPRFYEPIVSIQKESLEGIWFSEPVRNLINILEHNKYDAFPSLHAAITLTTLIVIAQYKKKWLYYFLPLSAGIFISLVYCRYHYVIDIIAGIVWTIACWWLTEWLFKRKFRNIFVPFYY